MASVTYMWYLGKWHKPKVHKGDLNGVKNVFYRTYKCSLAHIQHVFGQFIMNLYFNPHLYSGSGKLLKYKWKLLGVYFDDPSKLVNPSDFRFILGMQITDALSEE